MQYHRSPGVPAYIQIATLIRHRIASGELRPGDLLPSLRAAAKLWGVNLHTVRQAYHALEADGFVVTAERQATQVAQPSLTELWDEIDQFLDWVTTTATERFALRSADIAARLLARPNHQIPDGEKIWFLECSTWLASSLAHQAALVLSRPVHPWPIEKARELPPGRCISTYYHLPEVQRALAGRPERPRFVTVRLDEANLAQLRAALDPADPRLVVCGIDCATAQAIAVDLQAGLGVEPRIDVRTARDTTRLLAKVPAGIPTLVSPQHWDRLSAKQRARPGIFPLALRLNENDLDQIAHDWGISRTQKKGVKHRTVNSPLIRGK